jgi:hypothetical protein
MQPSPFRSSNLSAPQQYKSRRLDYISAKKSTASTNCITARAGTNNFAMASQKLPSKLSSFLCKDSRPLNPRCHCIGRRKASTFVSAIERSEDVVPSSSHQAPGPSEEVVKSFNPVARSRSRKTQLPPSRYVRFCVFNLPASTFTSFLSASL